MGLEETGTFAVKSGRDRKTTGMQKVEEIVTKVVQATANTILAVVKLRLHRISTLLIQWCGELVFRSVHGVIFSIEFFCS